MRDHELYVADCVDCHKPVESRALPVPANPFDPDQMETVSISELGLMNKDRLRELVGPLLVTEGKERERRVAVVMSYGLYMKIQKAIGDVHKQL